MLGSAKRRHFLFSAGVLLALSPEKRVAPRPPIVVRLSGLKQGGRGLEELNDFSLERRIVFPPLDLFADFH
jgi:hypothetical protein